MGSKKRKAWNKGARIKISEEAKQRLRQFNRGSWYKQVSSSVENNNEANESKDANDTETNKCQGPSTDQRYFRRNWQAFRCTFCNERFGTTNLLAEHTQQTHTGEEPYNCQVCQCTFKTALDLKHHTRAHKEENKHHCEYCLKSFVRSEGLNIHIRVAHLGEKPFICEQCSYASATPHELTKHRKREHKIEKKSKGTKNASLSKKGSDSQHDTLYSGAKKSGLCKKRSDAKKYIGVNSLGAKLHKCIKCEKEFLLFASFKIHVKTCIPGSEEFL